VFDDVRVFCIFMQQQVKKFVFSVNPYDSQCESSLAHLLVMLTWWQQPKCVFLDNVHTVAALKTCKLCNWIILEYAKLEFWETPEFIKSWKTVLKVSV